MVIERRHVGRQLAAHGSEITRLERGRFQMPPVSRDGAAIEMDATMLAMLLDGIDVGRVRRPEPWRPAA